MEPRGPTLKRPTWAIPADLRVDQKAVIQVRLLECQVEQFTHGRRLYGLTRLAEALVRQNEHRAALAATMEGRKAQEQTGHRQWEAELRRLEGLALVGLNRPDEGQNALKEALRIAQRQKTKSYELRAATSLARLWGERGRRAEARDLLAPIYYWFTEGFDTADLKEAKGLLDELT